MISAGLTNAERKAIYRRDHWRCGVCDSDRNLQIHHCIPRGQGGSNHPHNLITLCSDCHALAHGTDLRGWIPREELAETVETVNQEIIEYLADQYAPDWNPWNKHPLDG